MQNLQCYNTQLTFSSAVTGLWPCQDSKYNFKTNKNEQLFKIRVYSMSTELKESSVTTFHTKKIPYCIETIFVTSDSEHPLQKPNGRKAAVALPEGYC